MGDGPGRGGVAQGRRRKYTLAPHRFEYSAYIVQDTYLVLEATTSRRSVAGGHVVATEVGVVGWKESS